MDSWTPGCKRRHSGVEDSLQRHWPL